MMSINFSLYSHTGSWVRFRNNSQYRGVYGNPTGKPQVSGHSFNYLLNIAFVWDAYLYH